MRATPQDKSIHLLHILFFAALHFLTFFENCLSLSALDRPDFCAIIMILKKKNAPYGHTCQRPHTSLKSRTHLFSNLQRFSNNMTFRAQFLRISLFLLIGIFSSISLFAGSPWASRHGLTGAQYQSAVNEFVGAGYRIAHASAFSVGSTPFFNVIFEKVNGPGQVAKHGLTSAQYQAKAVEMKNTGYKLTLVDGYSVGTTAYYLALWDKTAAPTLKARHDMSNEEYQQEVNQNKAAGYRLLWVDGMGLNGQGNYAAIWEKVTGPEMVARHGLTAAQYQTEVNNWVPKGYRITCLSSFNVGNTDYYAFIAEKTGGPLWDARHDMNNQMYQTESDNHYYTGFKPTLVTGCSTGAAQYAAVWENTGVWTKTDLDYLENTIEAYLKKYDVPGASIAITKNGNLVYARGFGLADKSTGEKVGTSSLFRIASVSKPITSAAIMKLTEIDANFDLVDKVFGANTLLGTTYGDDAQYSAREKAINLQMLLEHTAGGTSWANNGSDPMFSKPSMNQAELIGDVLDNREPDFTPGTQWAYSNFGYCALGRIIEKKTGQTYQNWVKSNILAPCGITAMQIGGDTKAQKKAKEVVYYGQNGDDPYVWKIARMDAHGGWIASAIDLARFCTHVDGFANTPDILSAASINTMTTPCSVASGYAKGWKVDNSDEWWHLGSLPGTGSIMMRTSSGYTLSFVTNSKDGNTVFFSDMENMIRGFVGGVKTWPAAGVDFF